MAGQKRIFFWFCFCRLVGRTWSRWFFPDCLHRGTGQNSGPSTVRTEWRSAETSHYASQLFRWPSRDRWSNDVPFFESMEILPREPITYASRFEINIQLYGIKFQNWSKRDLSWTRFEKNTIFVFINADSHSNYQVLFLIWLPRLWPILLKTFIGFIPLCQFLCIAQLIYN